MLVVLKFQFELRIFRLNPDSNILNAKVCILWFIYIGKLTIW